MENYSEIESRYDSQQIVQVQMNAIEAIKPLYKELAVRLERLKSELGADPYYLSLAQTYLENAAMWSTKAITHGK